MRPLLTALLLVALSSVSACSDDPPLDTSTTPSATPSDAPSDAPSETAASELPPARNACKVLDPQEVGRVLGTTVERVTAEQGCRFANPDDPATASLGLSQGELAASGGLDGAKAGVGTVIEGEMDDLPDVGDGAFVTAGPAFGGDTPTGGGAVALGSSLIQITVIPGPDATDDSVRATTVDVLTLIAEKAQR
jgi:hypothetical protein